ncbi:MAG: 50S ribosomal protein L25 [Patescibacteria group bacterium]|jgi:large subunit ribosomal protein L25
METIQLTVAPRTEVQKKVQKLRKQGLIPAVLYGHGLETAHIQVGQKELTHLLRTASESSLIDLTIADAAPVKVLLHEVQRDPLTEEVIHVDFYQVRMDEKLETEIPLHFVGESAAVKNEGGILVKNHDHLKVRVLPGDLVPSIEVDITALASLNTSLKLKDITLPKGIEPLIEQEEVLVVVTPPRSDEELKLLEEEITEDVAAVEGGEKAEEGAATAEGDAEGSKEEKKGEKSGEAKSASGGKD